MASDQMVSVLPIWQLGHVRKRSDVFAKTPNFFHKPVLVELSVKVEQLLETKVELFGPEGEI